MAAFLVLAVLLLTGCSGGEPSEKVELAGVVEIGPTPGPCIRGIPCAVPARGVELEFTREGQAAVRVTSDERGHYKVRLEPGVYRVRAVEHPRPATLHPATVTVRGDSRRDFYIDSGVR
jgi:hypothetical protein